SRGPPRDRVAAPLGRKASGGRSCSLGRGDQLSMARPPVGAYVVLARIASRSATARWARAGSLSRNAAAIVSYAKTYPSRPFCDGTSTQPRGRGRAAVSPPRYTPNRSAADRGTFTKPRPCTSRTLSLAGRGRARPDMATVQIGRGPGIEFGRGTSLQLPQIPAGVRERRHEHAHVPADAVDLLRVPQGKGVVVARRHDERVGVHRLQHVAGVVARQRLTPAGRGQPVPGEGDQREQQYERRPALGTPMTPRPQESQCSKQHGQPPLYAGEPVPAELPGEVLHVVQQLLPVEDERVARVVGARRKHRVVEHRWLAELIAREH